MRETAQRRSYRARHDDRQVSSSGARECKRTSGRESGTTEETVTAGAGTYRAAKRKKRRITSRVITGLEQEVEKPVVLNAEGRPIGAQIGAAKARLARALKAEDQLKKRWPMFEEHVNANQQENTAAQATLQELTSKTKDGAGKTGGQYNHRETALEQILELIETTWPAGQAAPRANEMVHQARSVLGRSRSRSKLHSKKRDMNAHAVTADSYQPEKM